jgi:hypothetical protein
MPLRKRPALLGVLAAGTVMAGCYHPLPLTSATGVLP